MRKEVDMNMLHTVCTPHGFPSSVQNHITGFKLIESQAKKLNPTYNIKPGLELSLQLCSCCAAQCYDDDKVIVMYLETVITLM